MSLFGGLFGNPCDEEPGGELTEVDLRDERLYGP